MSKFRRLIITGLLLLGISFTVCSQAPFAGQKAVARSETAVLNDIAEYDGSPYVTVNNNIPFFTGKEDTSDSYEQYSELDRRGRCGQAMANIGKDILPTEERGEIGMIKPSGWKTVKYDIVDGKYLYNRCHLIGYQLTGENANEKNLFTGTRSLNIKGMLPFENDIASYVRRTGNHVLYRATPIYDGDNLLASGVLMEAKSVEDDGQGVCFNVYAYNNQPGIEIDYETGESHLIDEEPKDEANHKRTYYLNTSSHKFHLPSCPSVQKMSEANKKKFTGNRKKLIKHGYEACQNCNP